MESINKHQLEMIEHIVTGKMASFTIITPQETDSPADFENWTLSNADAASLVTLGLFEDVSNVNKEYVQHLKVSTGRDFTVFQLTEMGEKLFDASKGTAIN